MDSTVVIEPEASARRPIETRNRITNPAAPKKWDITGNTVPLLSLVVGLAVGLAGGAWLEWSHIENDIVATVNGTPIRAGEFNHRLQIAAGTQVLSQIVTDDLRLQFAQQQNAYPTDDQIKAKLIKAEGQPNFQKNLIATHQVVDDIKRQLTVHLAEAGPIEQGVTASDADAQAFYTANIDPKNPRARYYHPATVRIAAIVTTTQEKANLALNALASGYSFAAVAQAYTQLNGTLQGGLLPPFEKGKVDGAKFPGLENLIFGLSKGQQTGITKIGAGYWIIRCIDTAPQITIPYGQVADECQEGALLTKGIQENGQKIQQAEQAFQKSVVYKANWPGYDQILTPGPDQAEQGQP